MHLPLLLLVGGRPAAAGITQFELLTRMRTTMATWEGGRRRKGIFSWHNVTTNKPPQEYHEHDANPVFNPGYYTRLQIKFKYYLYFCLKEISAAHKIGFKVHVFRIFYTSRIYKT